MKTLTCDFLIIGSGLAGLSAALELSKNGKVIVISKVALEECNSLYAQGGIACVMDEKDTLENHINDTLNSGCGLSQKEIVQEIINKGQERINSLVKLGLKFDLRDGKETEYDLGKEGGHSNRRILHVGDSTGKAIMKTLNDAIIKKKNISILTNLMAIDLITTSWMKIDGDNQCVGAYFLDKENNDVLAIKSKSTLLATGGLGKVYPYTSNPDIATGDGIAMAWRAGVSIRNMEFIQFHPTCLYHPEAKSFLISEAVRGEGGKLVDIRGNTFMDKFDSRGSLATRDITARAIDAIMKKYGDPYVYLDITNKTEDFLKTRFPNLFSACLKYGINMSKHPIPVVPAAHYSCGGIISNVNGKTSLSGLYTAGEVASTGLHGANRLASNSLLEALVCGHESGIEMSKNISLNLSKINIPKWKLGVAVYSNEAVVVEHNWNEVRTCMWDYVGIVRTNKRLVRAKARISNLRKEIKQYYKDYFITSDLLELRNIADVAEIIIKSALFRKESVGLHYMEDFPQSKKQNIDTIIKDHPGGPLN